MKSIACFLIFSFFLAGCGGRMVQRGQEEAVFVTENDRTVLMAPEKLKGNVSEVQIMEGTYGKNAYRMNSVLKMDEKEIRLIGFSDAVRLLTLVYDGKKVSAEFAPFFPKRKEMGAYILWDIQLIYYPLDAVKNHLPEMDVSESVLRDKTIRTIAKGGEIFIEITYAPENREIEFENKERGYRYKISRVGEDGA